MQQMSDGEFKHELVREVTDAVREQIDRKTTAAVDLLWQRGHLAVQTIQSQQTSQNEQLRGQLAACTESYRNLERENAALRSGLEALMKHLTVVFGAPPHMQPPQLTVPVSPGGACGMPSAAQPPKPSPLSAFSGPSLPTTSQSGYAEPPTEGADGSCDIDSSKGTHTGTEDFHTRSGSPERSSLERADELVEAGTTQSLPPSPALPRPPTAPMTQSNGEAATTPLQQPPLPAPVLDTAAPPGLGPASSEGTETEAAPTVTAAPPAGGIVPVDTFNLTLRRADNVPLGLELQPGVPGDGGQLVEAVHPGGAIEAWNRQCAGDTREIRVGDRIVSINGHEDSESMWEECRTKQLIRMTVLRGSPQQTQQQAHVVPLPGEPPMLERTASGMRADANEFVPQVSPWAP